MKSLQKIVTLKSSRRAQRGQVLILFVLLVATLIGFAGLSMDGSLASLDHRQLQGAADAAALADSYELLPAANGGAGASTFATAETVAKAVAAQDGCAASVNCTFTFTYYTSANVVTATVSAVDHLQVVISADHANSFIQIVGGPTQTTVSVAAVASLQSSASGGTRATCAFCALNPGAATNAITNSGAGTTNIYINSGALWANGAISFSSGTGNVVSGAAIKTQAAAAANTTGTWAFNPAIMGSAGTYSDQWSSVGLPTISTTLGASVTITTNTILLPGIYGQINITGAGVTVIFQPGTYEFTGGISVSGAGVTLQGAGVTLIFTCGTYPTPTACTAGGAVGAVLTLSNTVNLDLSAPLTGSYANMLIYYDKNNTSALSLGANVLSANMTGGIYAARSAFSWTSFPATTAPVQMGGPIIVGTISVGSGNLYITTGWAGFVGGLYPGVLRG